MIALFLAIGIMVKSWQHTSFKTSGERSFEIVGDGHGDSLPMSSVSGFSSVRLIYGVAVAT